MASDDAQTDLKKRARRRLVGAAALALLAVIVLPMIMDPEPKPAGEDIQVRIPSESGRNATARSIELPAAPSVAEPSAPTPPSEPVAAVEPATPAPAPSPAPHAEPPATKPAPTRSEAAPAVKPAKPDEAERVAAILSGKSASAAAPVDDKGPGFVVQVGAFSNEASASALSEKIRQAGFKAYTRKVGSTTRVRVGPYDNRDEAESVAARMAGKGFKGVVMPRG
jgi:DedD protein